MIDQILMKRIMMKREELQPLSDVPAGTECMIREINSTPETRQRLMEIGIRENTVVRTVMSNPSQMICEVNTSRIGLHRRLAQKIVIGRAKRH